MARKRIATKKKRTAKRAPASRVAADTSGNPEKKQLVISLPEGAGVPEIIVEELVRTRAWILVAAVLQFIFAVGALGYGGIGMVYAFLAKGDDGITIEALGAAVFGLLFLIAGTILITIGVRMLKFNGATSSLLQTGSEDDLAEVLNYLHGFWKLLGGSITTLMILFAVIVAATLNATT